MTTTCDCGCNSLATIDREACTCGCDCCAPPPRTDEEEAAELRRMREHIDRRLAELERS